MCHVPVNSCGGCLEETRAPTWILGLDTIVYLEQCLVMFPGQASTWLSFQRSFFWLWWPSWSLSRIRSSSPSLTIRAGTRQVLWIALRSWRFVRNAAVLLVIFIILLFLGLMLDPSFPKFGLFMASTVHILRVTRMVGFFEFLVNAYYLHWDMD